MTVVPFLKWPGGKRWFVAQHAAVLPGGFKRYIEPFLGSGSVFFHLRPARAVLADTNRELIDAYRAIRDDWTKLGVLITRHHSSHGKRHYYEVRDSRPRSLIGRAARLIYLNRTCFNGIYRVNAKGEFNVPKGTKDSVLLPTDDFATIAKLLARADLRVADFEESIDEAGTGDLIFADPPYTVRHNNNAFIKYNEVLFSWADQVRLADALGRARDRGANIVCTNANHRSIRALYREREFELKTVWRFSPISADPARRRRFDEVVILATHRGTGNGHH